MTPQAFPTRTPMAHDRIDTHHHIVPPAYADWLAQHGITAGGLPIPQWSVDAALAQINQALALCAGPRRIGMYELRASIQHGLGQTPAAMQSLRAAMAIVQGQVKPGAPPPGKLASLEKLLATLESTQPPGAPVPPAAPKSPAKPPVPTRPPTPLYQPGDAVARELAREPVDKKPARPSRKVAKRDPGP